MPIIQTKSCQCVQCKHIWIPGEWRRTSDYPLPRWCPKCKSARWNEGELVNKDTQPIVKRNVVKQRKVKPIVAPTIEQLIDEGKVTRGLPADQPPKEYQSMNEAIDAKLAGKCPHKKMRGEVCYKCDPKFGTPKIR